ncbi:MAG: DUF6077 domain-containing protein [Lachnospiraceae bacterium]|nr:DUF6077 domain-containing protein [Lachnospiraceae bacterium]
MTITVLKLIASCIMILFVSYFTGRLFVTNREGKFMISCATGLIAQWGVFFIIAMPLVYLKKTVTLVMKLYFPLALLLVVAGLVYTMYSKLKSSKEGGLSVNAATAAGNLNKLKAPLTREEILYLGIFLGVLIFQLYKTIFFAVADGDDAFYVAVAEYTRVADGLYNVDPYTGYPTTMLLRYSLAPFPIFIGIIARVTGLAVSSLAHIAIPVTFILISYIIYNAIAKCLFKEARAKRYMFMALLSIFAMFSNYSINTAETFMLTRSRQGKEALAAIVLPYLFFMFFEIADGGLKKFKNFAFLILLSFAATLCSLFGNIVCEIVYLAFFIYLCINKASLKEKLSLIIIAIPGGVISLLYLLMK